MVGDLERIVPELSWLPDINHLVFEHPPLVTALCQVQFATVLGIEDPSFVAPFQRAIQSEYPITNPSASGQIEIIFGSEPGSPELRRGLQSRQWRFVDQQDNWTVVLASNFVTLETRAYDTFVDFLNRLHRVLDAVIEHIQPNIGTRIGLRYVNEIRPVRQRLSSVIRRELLGPLSIRDLLRDATQAVQQVSLRFPNAEGIVIQHGLLPGGTSVLPRRGSEVPGGSFYLLDFDAFREFKSPETLSMDPDIIAGYVEEYHAIIYRLFRWSVTDRYISTMEVRQRDG